MFSAILYFFLSGFLIFILLYFRVFLLLNPAKRLPILMYHKIQNGSADELSVSVENLEKQLAYLQKRGYEAIFFKNINACHRQKIIITFDDGYYDNFLHLPALLEKYGMKATIFIPTKFIQNGYGNAEMMRFADLRNLDKDLIEIGLHSHSHENFRNLSAKEIREDLRENMRILDNEQIPYSKVLAYPYGKFPKKNPEKSELFLTLKNLEIQFGVRIGNKINALPIKKPYEICRIDIKNSDGLFKFKLKLIFGRLKLF